MYYLSQNGNKCHELELVPIWLVDFPTEVVIIDS